MSNICLVCRQTAPSTPVIKCGTCGSPYHWSCGKSRQHCVSCGSPMRTHDVGTPINMGDDASVDRLYKIEDDVQYFVKTGNKDHLVKSDVKVQDLIDLGVTIEDMSKGLTWADLKSMGLKVQHLARKDIFIPELMLQYKISRKWFMDMFPKSDLPRLKSIYTLPELEAFGFSSGRIV